MTIWTKTLLTAGLALVGTSGIASAQVVTTTPAPAPAQPVPWPATARGTCPARSTA